MDFLDKLSALTTIDKRPLEKLLKKTVWVICNDIHQAMLRGENIAYVDIGIGTLGFDFSSGDSIKYKFIPNKDVEKEISVTIVSGENPLTDKVEQSLVKKIVDTYKDLF